MNKAVVFGLGCLGIIILVLAGLFAALAGGYNGLVRSSTAVDASWAQVQTQYQRRADLIPNLVRTVEGAANFEKSTLTDVVNARANATKVTIDPSKLCSVVSLPGVVISKTVPQPPLQSLEAPPPPVVP